MIYVNVLMFGSEIDKASLPAKSVRGSYLCGGVVVKCTFPVWVGATTPLPGMTLMLCMAEIALMQFIRCIAPSYTHTHEHHLDEELRSRAA